MLDLERLPKSSLSMAPLLLSPELLSMEATSSICFSTLNFTSFSWLSSPLICERQNLEIRKNLQKSGMYLASFLTLARLRQKLELGVKNHLTLMNLEYRLKDRKNLENDNEHFKNPTYV